MELTQDPDNSISGVEPLGTASRDLACVSWCFSRKTFKSWNESVYASFVKTSGGPTSSLSLPARCKWVTYYNWLKLIIFCVSRMQIAANLKSFANYESVDVRCNRRTAKP